MMNVYANVKGVFNLLELNLGDIPLPDRGDVINLGGFLTSKDRLKLTKQDANTLWPNRGYEGRNECSRCFRFCIVYSCSSQFL